MKFNLALMSLGAMSVLGFEVKRRSTQIEDCDEDDAAIEFAQCISPVFAAWEELLETIDDEDVRSEVDLLFFEFGENFVPDVTALTSEDFLCDNDFLETMHRFVSCDFSVCGATCDNTDVELFQEVQTAYESSVAFLESCGSTQPSFCSALLSAGESKAQITFAASILAPLMAYLLA